MNQRELFRQIIAGCDEALKDAFIRRMEASLNVAQGKMESGEEIFDAGREQQIIEGIATGLNAELSLKAQSLWSSLLRMSRNRQYTYFVRNDKSLRLTHECDLLDGDMTDGTVACPGGDARMISSLFTMEVLPCSSILKSIAALEEGKAAYACVTTDSFYDSDWLFNMVYDKRIYINRATPAQDGRYAFLLSKKLYDLPENEIVSIAFSVHTEQPGSLAQTLEVFSDQKINLEFLRYKTQNIETDSQEKINYVFADFRGKLMSVPVRAALLQLEKELPFFRVLGYRQEVD